MPVIDHDANPLHLRYLAGYFDARGGISIAMSTLRGRETTGVYGGRLHHYQLVLKASGRTSEAPNLFRAEFGGIVEKPRSDRIGGYIWVARSQYAEQALRALLPHLHVKREQGGIALAFTDAARNHSLRLQAARREHREEQQRSSGPYRVIVTNNA
ncbi:MAG: hypothetical protein KDD77_07815, partial [Caldilineaceae bacterium]|nr:hypothetical protein [Caldilineaceae bacterium]